MVNYFRRFIPAVSILKPLMDARRDNPKKLVWSPEMQTSFQHIKWALASAARSPGLLCGLSPGNRCQQHARGGRPAAVRGWHVASPQLILC